MNKEVRTFLIDLARNRTNQTITYQKLSDKLNLDLDMQEPHHRKMIGEILGEISEFEFENGRPLLSSLVIRLGDLDSGNGFFKLAEDLGFGGWKFLKDNYFQEERITETINFWSNGPNYAKYYNI